MAGKIERQQRDTAGKRDVIHHIIKRQHPCPRRRRTLLGKPALHNHQQAVITKAQHHPQDTPRPQIVGHHVTQRRHREHRAKYAETADMPHPRHHPVRRDGTENRADKKCRIQCADGGVVHPHLRELHARRVQKQTETGKQEENGKKQ